MFLYYISNGGNDNLHLIILGELSQSGRENDYIFSSLMSNIRIENK